MQMYMTDLTMKWTPLKWHPHCRFSCIQGCYVQGAPILLEPIMRVEVTTPEDYMGDVIGDINSRRGRIEGMDDIGGGKMIRGFVPLAEMFGYATDLRSRTQGRGNYSMFFEKYEQVPQVCTGKGSGRKIR